MELRRYGFLSLLICFSFAISACSQSSGSKPASAEQPYDWNRNEAEENSVDDCASPSATRDATVPAGIVGGEEVHKSSWLARGTVFLMQNFTGEDGRVRTSICTATLVDTNVVLTAAHCVDKSKDNFTTNLSVYFTPHPECDNKKGRLQQKRRKVTALMIHPNWNPDESRTVDRGDLALLRISGRAPTQYHPLRLSKYFIPITESSPILVVGFGMVNPDYYGPFGGPITLRVTQAPGISETEKDTLLSLTASSIEADEEWHEFDNAPQNEMLYIDQSHKRGICGGDSGGPSIMKNDKGEDVVTGVASFVMNPEDPNKLCGYVAAHTSIYFHKAWLERAFSQIKNSDSELPALFY